jgi:hypothetical protein
LWYRKLKKAGFSDIEDSKERLKSKDTRTKAFQNQDAVRVFYADLDHYILTQETMLDPVHLRILQLYSEGMYVVRIALAVGLSRSRVNQILLQHRKIIKAGHFPCN